MNDFDAWIFFDGPAPESLRQTLDALRDPLPEDEELELLALLEQVDAKLSPPPEGASGPVLLDDAEVESAPPTPCAPALPKEEEAPDPPPRAGRPPAFLASTALSPVPAASIQPALARVWEGRLAASPQMRAQAGAIRAGCLEKARTMGQGRSGGA
jgi:hypothetical protein